LKIVLTNDDGIAAPGIAALLTAVQQLPLAEPIAPFLVAPDRQYSGCGHQVTTHAPITVTNCPSVHGSDLPAYAIGGTPADCTRLAVATLCPEVDWVLSGINAGGNLGVDQYISGTLAAVREAAILGIPGIAISQYIDRTKPLDWARSSHLTQQVLTALIAQGCPRGTYWNVNLPHLDADAADPTWQFCPADRQPLPLQYQQTEAGWLYQGNYQGRDRQPGHDVAVCFGGQVAITQLVV